MTNDLITTAELAEILKRSPATLMRWRRLRSGPPYLRVQGRVLYSRATINEWLQAQEVSEVSA